MIGTTTGKLTLVRLAAELTLKSRRTRSQFLRRLVANLADALDTHGIAHEIEESWGRMYVRADSDAATPLLARIFGISSVSPVARVVPAQLDEIVESARDLFTDDVRDRHFAVRARRVGTHDFSSHDIEVQLGTALLPHAAGVRLGDPEVTVHVEVRDERAFLFTGRIAGVGGLPLGVEGRAVALLSGGFDSAVAAWLIMKRGVALDYVFCNLGGDAYERAVLHVAKVLSDEWSWGTRPKLHIVDFAEPLRSLRETVKQSYWQVVLKRLMYRAASRIGEATGALGIVTGESIGQVSSQTLSNLQAIEPAASLPVFRPLVGFDKEEIIVRARGIGTAALSEQVREYCAIAPGKPVTAASPARAAEAESAFEHDVLERAIDARRTLDLRALAPTDLVAPYLFTTTIPDDAIVFDIRPPEQFRAMHLPGAIQRDEWDLLRAIPSLDKDRTYVLCCTHGIQTAYLAEKMQRAGIEAHSFKGGIRAAMAWVRTARSS